MRYALLLLIALVLPSCTVFDKLGFGTAEPDPSVIPHLIADTGRLLAGDWTGVVDVIVGVGAVLGFTWGGKRIHSAVQKRNGKVKV